MVEDAQQSQPCFAVTSALDLEGFQKLKRGVRPRPIVATIGHAIAEAKFFIPTMSDGEPVQDPEIPSPVISQPYVYANDVTNCGPEMQWEALKHARIPEYVPVEEQYVAARRQTACGCRMPTSRAA